ncbi:MAG: MBL fold metallo-hydrolase [Bacteroidota bacterium]
MSLFIASLNSGSNGNCYYVGNNEEAVLVDVGISCREIEKRMKLLELDPKRLKAIFITHEHIDHISGLPTFIKKYRIPVYITAATYQGSGFLLEAELVYSFTAFEPIQIGTLSVTAFPKMHDASDPHSVVVTCAGVTAGVFTDIGEPCKNVIKYFRICHAVFLEANYDDDMLANGNYPIFLRNRISGKRGHLSNAQALELFRTNRSPFMTHVLLSHLSKENNSPVVAEALFNKHANNVHIIHAPRDKSTPVYHIISSPATSFLPVMPAMPSVEKKKVAKPKLQLSLF